MKFFYFILLCASTLVSAAASSVNNDAGALLADATKASNDSLLWGPYRPGLFFGVRPRIYKSLMGALVWSTVNTHNDVQQFLRSDCVQNAGFDGYGWDEYDVRSGGVQTIHDVNSGYDITINFVKVPGGEHGGSWGARVKFSRRSDAQAGDMLTVAWVTTLEGPGHLAVQNEFDQRGIMGDVVLEGESAGLGSYTLTVTEGKGNHPIHNHPSYAQQPLDRTFVWSTSVPESDIWNAAEILKRGMQHNVNRARDIYGDDKLPPSPQFFTVPHEGTSGNAHAIQKVFQGSFEFDIIFSSGSATVPLTSKTLTSEIKRVSAAFKTRFNQVFDFQAPFDAKKYKSFAESMFSNLFGGLGYFAGNHKVDRQHDEAFDEMEEGFDVASKAAIQAHTTTMEESGPNELFTTVPSRPFFPRGFMWDEGFHLIPIANYDLDVTLEVVQSWYSLIDEDGWIAREQILGPEAQARVPAEFMVQYPHYANPPTLFLMVEQFVDRLAEVSNGTANLPAGSSLHLLNPELAHSFLGFVYPLLVRHYEWFRRTQSGGIAEYDREAFSSKEGYRWRGRTTTHILTSGLDDYPRALVPHPGELHVDLISWIGLMSRSLKRIATYLGETDDISEFTRHEYAIVRNIDDLHWSNEHNTFCDSAIDDFEESVHVCHKGYVSIMPFLTGHLPPDSPRMGAILSLIGNKDELWSDYGIRSLSKTDAKYGTGEDYWRGAIWMNLNYMCLRELLKVAQSSTEHAKYASSLYAQLRFNLVDNVYNVWKKTGFAFEQYNDMTGAGQRTQHFTGWTALVVKIMTMPELKGGHDEL